MGRLFFSCCIYTVYIYSTNNNKNIFKLFCRSNKFGNRPTAWISHLYLTLHSVFTHLYSYTSILLFTTAHEKPVSIFRIIFIFVPWVHCLFFKVVIGVVKLLMFLFLFQIHFNPFNDLANNLKLHMQKNNVWLECMNLDISVTISNLWCYLILFGLIKWMHSQADLCFITYIIKIWF